MPWAIEDIYAANPGLAAFGPVLPSGRFVNLPDLPDAPTQATTIRLWS